MLGDVRGEVLRPPHDKAPAAEITNENKEFRSFKSKEKIEDGSHCTVSVY